MNCIPTTKPRQMDRTCEKDKQRIENQKSIWYSCDNMPVCLGYILADTFNLLYISYRYKTGTEKKNMSDMGLNSNADSRAAKTL